MKKQLVTLGLVGLISSGCATSEWKKAINEVDIEPQTSCYDYAKEWSKEANRLGYDTRPVVFFQKENHNMPHAIVELKQEDGKWIYIEPQINWKTKMFNQQVFPMNFNNHIEENKYRNNTNNYYKTSPVRDVNWYKHH